MTISLPQGMKKMYVNCRLVHADLSEYNMLWHEGRIVFIDVSQSVEPSHPHGLEFLLRDCTNVSGFFTRAGLGDTMTPHQLFNYVSGLEMKAESNEEFLVQVSCFKIFASATTVIMWCAGEHECLKVCLGACLSA